MLDDIVNIYMTHAEYQLYNKEVVLRFDPKTLGDNVQQILDSQREMCRHLNHLLSLHKHTFFFGMKRVRLKNKLLLFLPKTPTDYAYDNTSKSYASQCALTCTESIKCLKENNLPGLHDCRFEKTKYWTYCEKKTYGEYRFKDNQFILA